MDNLLNAGGGAATSNLSTPQKVLAILLSIILVVGLSPFGQAPAKAYAAAATPTGNQEAALTLKLTDQTYTSESVKTKLQGTLTVLDTEGHSVPSTADGIGTTAPTFYYYDNEADARDGKATELDPINAGVYWARVEYANNGKFGNQWNVVKFQVNPYNIGDVNFYAGDKTQDATAANSGKAIEEVANGFTYDGKAHKLDWAAAGTGATYKSTTYETVFVAAKADVGTAFSAADTGANEVLTLGKDFTASVDELEEPGTHTVTITGTAVKRADGTYTSGNYTGTNSNITVTVAPSVFVTGTANNADSNLTANTVGAKAAKVTVVAGTGNVKKGVVDFTTTNTKDVDGNDITPSSYVVPYGDSSDPVTLFFGSRELNDEVTDYSVSYIEQTQSGTSPDFTYADKAGATASATAPTERGFYKATITATNDSRFDILNHDTTYGKDCKTVEVIYEIGAGSLTTIAKTATVGEGKYLAGEKVEPDKSTVKFFDKDGNDVTDKVGVDNFEFTYANTDDGVGACEVWTRAMQEDETYKQKGALTAWVAYTSPATSTDQYPAGAGAYKVTIKGVGEFAGGTATDVITTRFDVKENDTAVNKGTALGDIDVTFDQAAYTGKDQTYTYRPTVKMITSIDPTTKKATWTAVPATEYDVDFGTATFKEPGTYSATVNFKGNMKGESPVSGQVTIGTGEASSIISKMTVEDTVFNAKAQSPEVKFFDTAATPAEFDPAYYGATYELSYTKATSDPVEAGNYGVKATFSGNYTGVIEGDNAFIIRPLSQSDAIVLFKNGNTYTDTYSAAKPTDGTNVEPDYVVAVKDGKEFTSERTVVFSSEIAKDASVASSEKAYTAEFTNNTDKGTATLTLTPNKEYKYASSISGNLTQNFTIANTTFAADLITADSVTLGEDKDFTGAPQSFTVQVAKGSTNLEFGTSYGVVIRDKDGKTLTVSTDYTANPSATGVTIAGVTDKNLINAGAYTVSIVTGTDGNYAGTIEKTFTINQVELTSANITFAFGMTASAKGYYDPWSLGYDEATANSEKGIVFNAADSGASANSIVLTRPQTSPLSTLTLAYDTDYTISYVNNKAAGTATATFEAVEGGNYKGSVDKSFTIAKGTLDLTNATGYKAPQNPNQQIHGGKEGYVFEWTDTDMGAGDTMTYTGSAIEPAFKIFHMGIVNTATTAGQYNWVGVKDGVLDPSNYTVTWKKNTDVDYNGAIVNAGAQLILSGAGNYAEAITGGTQNFTIVPVDIADEKSGVEIADIPDQEATADGSAVIPEVTITYNGMTLEQGAGEDFTVESDNAGKPGEYTATITPTKLGNYTASKTVTKSFKIAKASQEITGATTYAKTYGAAAFKLALSAPGALTYVPDNSGVVSVAADGTVTVLKAGTAKIAVKAAETDQYAEAETTVTVNVAQAANPVTAKAAASVIAVKGTTQITSSGIGTVSFSSSNSAIATVSAKGVVTGKKAGKANITVRYAGDANHAAGTATVTVQVKKANTLTVKAKTAKVKYSAKKNQTVKRAKALTVSKAKGKVTYKKVSGNNKITVKASNGNVTVKKGLKKGTYKVKVAVTAAGNSTYAAKTVTKTFKVKVTK